MKNYPCASGVLNAWKWWTALHQQWLVKLSVLVGNTRIAVPEEAVDPEVEESVQSSGTAAQQFQRMYPMWDWNTPRSLFDWKRVGDSPRPSKWKHGNVEWAEPAHSFKT